MIVKEAIELTYIEACRRSRDAQHAGDLQAMQMADDVAEALEVLYPDITKAARAAVSGVSSPPAAKGGIDDAGSP